MPCLFAVLFIEILGATEVDLFVPSFPNLQEIFHLSTFMVEMLLAVNLLCFCISSLFVGNLGDKYGRKPVIVGGLFIFIIGSICCTFATGFNYLLIGRALQGVGISGGVVLSYLVIADSYSVEKQQEIIGMITGVITLGMTAAPVIGSYINLFFGWRANFALLLILGIISLLLSVIYLPKPSSDDKVRISLREYLPIIKSERVNIYNFTLTFISQAYWLFVAIAPILYMNDLAVSLDIFGLYQGSVAVVFSIGSFSTGYLVKKYGMIKCLKFSSRLLLSSVILTIIATIFNVQTPIFITFIMLIISIANIIPVNVLWPIAIDIIPEAKGRVTAYVTSSRLIFTAISVQIAGYFHNGTFIPLGIMMSIFLFIGYIFLSKILIQEKNIISKYSEK